MKTLKVGLLLLAVSATAPCAKAQPGHVNGPDQSGTSIPVLAEGEIPFTQFQTAISVCYKKAASKILKIILGREIDLLPLEQEDGAGRNLSLKINNIPNYDAGGYYTAFVCGSGPHNENDPRNALILKESDLFPFRPKFSDCYQYGLTILANGYSGDLKAGLKLIINYAFYDTQDHKDEANTALSVVGIPALTGKLIDRSELSPLGQVINKRQFVQNPQFVPMAGRQFDLKNLEIWNADTNYTVQGITFDFTTVIDCVKSELAQPSGGK